MIFNKKQNIVRTSLVFLLFSSLNICLIYLSIDHMDFKVDQLICAVQLDKNANGSAYP